MEEDILKTLNKTLYYMDHDRKRTAKEIADNFTRFVEWLAYRSQKDIDLIGYWDAETQENKKVFCMHGSRSVIHDAMTIEQVYDYWITNIRDK